MFLILNLCPARNTLSSTSAIHQQDFIRDILYVQDSPAGSKVKILLAQEQKVVSTGADPLFHSDSPDPHLQCSFPKVWSFSML